MSEKINDQFGDSENGMPRALKERMSLLTPRERLYFMTMWPKSGVLYITSKPGIAKSAIAKSIAKKMGFAYQDLRLSMVDETDVGLYPDLGISDGVKCLNFVVPRWAIEANRRPTIIHFEELNRASLQVRNAALQLLLERQIGVDFKFNDSVLMISSGNLGEEDLTDVEEFDSALNNRLIHYSHSLSADEWIDNFAKDNVHSIITSYIRAYPERLYQNPTENTRAYATPRTWTFMSDFIVKNFGKDSQPKEFSPILREIAHSFIGNGAQRFLRYCEEMMNITILDVLNRYDEIKEDMSKFNRDKKSELIQALKEFEIKKFTDIQLENAAKFLKSVGDDELTAYLLHTIRVIEKKELADPKIKNFLKEFSDVLVNIKRINRPGVTK